VFAVPLLIVPPWINKFYILDLAPGKSFVEWLAGQGHTVFVVSWVNPDETAAAKTFADYMTEGILAALAAVLDITKQTQANAMGYCVGGTLLAATLAWLAARGDPRIASAALLTAQVDFTNAGDLSVFVDEAQLDAMEKRIAEQGYLAGQSMARTFNMLRSNDLVWSYAVNNYLMGREPPPFDLLYWNSDSTRLPAVNHLFYLRQCYVENRLARGEMELAGTRLDLGAIDVPIFNLATREDHIAPAPSVFNGGRMLGGAVRFVLAGSGHIAGVVNPPDKVKYQYWADGSGASLADWLATATETPGSWWPELQRWLEPFAGAQVKARRPGVRGYKAIEDAPGSYVRLRAD
jgi:polyhydroxyalkanoate synthase